MIGFKCACGYSIEAEGDPSEVFDAIDTHEEFCTAMNEVSSEHPAKNRIGADQEQSNTHQGVAMSANKTTAHSTVDRAEVDRLRSVRAMILESVHKLGETLRQQIGQRDEALASGDHLIADGSIDRLKQQIRDQCDLVRTYDQKISVARSLRDFPILKAAGWDEKPTYNDPDVMELEGPDVDEDSDSALAYFAWTPEDGTVVMIDTMKASDQLTLAQAQQFAYRLLTVVTETQRALEPTVFCIDSLDRQEWESIEPVKPAFPDDSTVYRRSWLLPYGARAEIDVDPREGKHSLGHVDVIGLEDLPGIDALEEVALDLLDFVDTCRSSRTAG